MYKTIACTIPRLNTNVNYCKVWTLSDNVVSMLSSSVVTNVLLWWDLLIVGDTMICEDREYMGNHINFVPSPQFCCEPKTSLKNKDNKILTK